MSATETIQKPTSTSLSLPPLTVHLVCDCQPLRPGAQAICGAHLRGIPMAHRPLDCIVCADLDRRNETCWRCSP